MLKFVIYIFCTIIVMWSMDAININSIFKQGEVIKARVCYFIIVLCLVYLLANFLYDFAYLKFF